MKLKSFAFAYFWLLVANPLVLNPAIAAPPARPTQLSRCKTLGLPAAPRLELSIETPAVQQAIKQASKLAKVSAHYAAAGLDTKADELATQAIQKLEQVGGKREYALTRLAFAYLDMKLYDRAFTFLNQQSDTWKAGDLLGLELKAQNDPTEPGLIAWMARAVRSLPASSIKVGLLINIAELYRSPEQTQQRLMFAREALQTAQAAQAAANFHNADYNFTRIAAQFRAVGENTQAAQLLAQSVAAIPTDHSETPEEVASNLTKIAHEYLLLGQVKPAITLLNRAVPLVQNLSHATIYSTNTALFNLAVEYTLAGKDAQALALMRSTKPIQGVNKLFDSYKGSLGVLAHQAAVANQPTTVLRLIGLIQDPQHKSDLQVFIVKDFVAIQAFASALQLAQTMTQADQKAIALGVIAAGYAKAGQSEKADQTLNSAIGVVQSIQGNNIAQTTNLIELARLQNAAGQPKRAIAILQLAQPAAAAIPPNGDYQFRAFLDMASQYSAAGQFEPAIKLLDQARQLIQTAKPTPPFLSFPSGDEARVEQLGQLAEQFAKAQQFSKALMIAGQLDASYCQFRTKTLLAIAQSALAAKQTEAADQILSQALKTAQTIDDSQVQFETLLAIAADFSNLGQQSQAAQILTQTQHLIPMN